MPLDEYQRKRNLWMAGRPAHSRGGAAGTMLREIIEKAALQRVAREAQRASHTTRSRRVAKTARARKSKHANT